MITNAYLIYDIAYKYLDSLDKTLINKPMLSIIFPSSGFLSTFIPDNILNNVATLITNSSTAIEFIDAATPYLKFMFLILTLILTVVSGILQIKKLFNKK